ncbi:MAG TPA: pitrilysin family protein [Candidatus Limnocylindria bacterium]
MDHRKVTLDNGMRVLVAEMPETRSVSLAVYVGVGSRVETKDNAGTSHFLEHMVFKGSAKRPTAADISQVIESKGGVVNASTDKEVTVFWSRVPARHYLVALDVIADLIRAPMLRPTDVDSERNVIVEELRMYRDQPQDRVHTLVDELLYPRHPLGWEVAGREEVVLGMTADRLRDFMQRGYAPSRTVVALAGPLNAEEAVDAVNEALGGLGPREPLAATRAPSAGKSRAKLFGKRAEQTNLCVGWRSVHTTHPDKFSIDMLNAVLGEGMSSRLFLELREKRGLAYDVHSYDANYSDAGHLVVYAGFAPANGPEVLTAILREIARLRDELVPDVEIERVRDFAKGRLELRLEDTRGVSGWLAGQELFLGRVRSVEEACAIIDGVTPADIQRVARQYLRPELAYVAAIGPRASLAAIAPPAAQELAIAMAS